MKKNREKCIEKGKQYYEDNKERLQKMARGQYKGLSKEEKKITKNTMQKIGTGIYLKKNNNEKYEKQYRKKYI